MITGTLLSGHKITIPLSPGAPTAAGIIHAIEDSTNRYNAFWKVYAGRVPICGAIDKYLPTRKIKVSADAELTLVTGQVDKAEMALDMDRFGLANIEYSWLFMIGSYSHECFCICPQGGQFVYTGEIQAVIGALPSSVIQAGLQREPRWVNFVPRALITKASADKCDVNDDAA